MATKQNVFFTMLHRHPPLRATAPPALARVSGKVPIMGLVVLSTLALLAGYWIVGSSADPDAAPVADAAPPSPVTTAERGVTLSPPLSARALGAASAPALTMPPPPQHHELGPTQRHFEYRDSPNGIAIATQPLQPYEYAQDPTHPVVQAVLFQLTPQKILSTHQAGEDMQFPLFDLGEVQVKLDDMIHRDEVILARGTIHSDASADLVQEFTLNISGSTVSGEFRIGERQFVMYSGPFGQTLAEVDLHRMPQKFD